MAAFIVTYDLHKQGQNYDCIIKKLNAYQSRWHMQGSVWIVSGDHTAASIRDNLKPCLDSNDTLFVGKLSAAAWFGFGDKGSAWLKNVIA